MDVVVWCCRLSLLLSMMWRSLFDVWNLLTCAGSCSCRLLLVGACRACSMLVDVDPWSLCAGVRCLLLVGVRCCVFVVDVVGYCWTLCDVCVRGCVLVACVYVVCFVLLLVVGCLLYVVCWRCVVRRWLFVVCCALRVVVWLLCVVRSSWFVESGLVLVVGCWWLYVDMMMMSVMCCLVWFGVVGVG